MSPEAAFKEDGHPDFSCRNSRRWIWGTSTAFMRSHQLRLHFSSLAYALAQTLRRLGLEGTDLAKAQCDTIRLKLFKIGAQLRVSVRKVWVSFSESYPYLSLFYRVFARLQQIPIRC